MSESKIYIYKISTPIINIDNNDSVFFGDYFDFEIINYCIKNKLINSKIERIKTFEKSKTIVLESYNDKEKERYAFGEFLTIAHGIKASSVEIENLTKTKEFTEKEGILNKVKFLIDKRNGHFFIEKDRNAVMNLSRLKQYLSIDKQRRLFYINEFNKTHKNVQIDTNRKIFSVSLLEPLPFLEQLRKIKKVKSVEIPISAKLYDKQKTGLINNMKIRANKNEIGTHKTKIVMTDFDHEKLSEELLNFFKYLIENQAYDDPKIIGSLNNNITRVFTPETSTRDLVIDVDIDNNGWIDKEIMISSVDAVVSEDDNLNIRLQQIFENETNSEKLLKQILNLKLKNGINQKRGNNFNFRLKNRRGFNE